MTVEEKSKRYVWKKLEENGYRNFHGGECVEDAFTAGYTQAVTDLSAENEKLREALSLLVEKVDAPLEFPDEWFNDLFDVATKAKQLITE